MTRERAASAALLFGACAKFPPAGANDGATRAKLTAFGRGPMIELTRDRLNEARFFLTKLQQEKVAQARPNKPPPEH
jgi:hypothetical protein